jgi:uncharacterized membrane protein YdjX (TVP38/TMEM64 family)
MTPRRRFGTAARVPRVVALVFVVCLVALAVVWRVTPLARIADPGVVAAYREQVRGLPLAPVVAIGVFVIASFIAAPATLMIGATMLLFGALPGAVYAWLGMMASGSLIFGIARMTARDVIDRWLARRAGSWLDTTSGRLQRRGFMAVGLMRLTPIPFVLQNVMAGASRIHFADFAGGTAVGILPVIALMAGVTTEFDAWLADPDWRRLAWLALAVAVALGVGWLLRRWAGRRAVGR